MPYSPWWALMVIGIDVLIIWALASYLRQPDVKSTEPASRSQALSSRTPAAYPALVLVTRRPTKSW